MFIRRQTSDESLVSRTLGGNRETFGELVERYLQAAHGVAFAHTGNHADAEDATQEAFLKAFRSLDSLHERARFGAWLVTIVRREAIQVLRGRQRELGMRERLGTVPESEPPEVLQRDTHDALREHVMALEEGQREAILLFYFAGKSIRETATLLGISNAAAQKRISRARESLSKSVVSALGAAQEDARPKQDRVKRVMGGLAAVHASWEVSQAAAAAGASGTAGTLASAFETLLAAPLAAKVASFVVVLAVLLLGFWVVDKSGSDASPGFEPQATATVGLSARDVAGDDSQIAEASDPGGAAVANAGGETTNASSAAQSTPETGPGAIRGVLMDERGEGVAGAVVTATLDRGFDDFFGNVSADDEEPRTATTDAEGRFELTRLPFGLHVVQALHEGTMALATVSISDAYTLDRDIALELYSCAPITGQVLGPWGAGVSGVNLVVVPSGVKDNYDYADSRLSRQDQFPFRQLRFESGADGAFSLFVWDGSWSITANRVGYAKVVLDNIQGGTEGLAVPLGAGGSVSGRVVLASSGEGLPGVNVFLLPTTPALWGDGFVRAESDVNGDFSILGLKDASYGLSFEHEVFAPDAAPILFAIDGEKINVNLGELPAIPGGAITGQLVDKETGSGIPDVQVRLEVAKQDFPSRMRGSTRTDSNGQFVETGLPEGEYHVAVVGNTKEYARPDPNTTSVTVPLSAGETLDSIDFRLTNEGSPRCTGRVVDDRGRAVENAIVEVTIPGYPGDIHGLSDANGAFEVAGLVATNELFLQARRRGLACLQAGPYTITDQGLQDVVLMMEPEASMSGVIVDGTGAPLPHIRILAQPTSEYRFGIPEARADRLGRFSVDGLSSGSYSVIPSSSRQPAERKLETPEDVTLNLEAGEHIYDLRIVLVDKGNLFISGRVTDVQGHPITGVNIHAQSEVRRGKVDIATSKTDASGCYEVTGLAACRYLMILEVARYTSPEIRLIEAGSKDVDYVLLGMGTIEGRAADAVTGRPVTAFKAGFGYRTDGAIMPPELQTINDKQGKFRFSVPAGEVYVVAEANGFAPGCVRVGQVSPDQTVNNIEIRLTRGAIVDGIVKDTTGTPLSGASIFVNQLPNKSRRRDKSDSTTDKAGRFRVDTLEPSEVATLIAFHPSYGPACVDVTPTAARNSFVEITLEQSSSIKGELWLDGLPLAKHPIRLRFPGARALNDGFQIEWTGADGSFAFNGLPPGEVEVTVKLQETEEITPPRLTLTQSVVVKSGGEAFAKLDFGNAWGALEGVVTVLGEPSEPLTAVIDVSVPTQYGEVTYRNGVKSGGVFHYDDIPAGVAAITCTAKVDGQSYVRQMSAEVARDAVTRIEIHLTSEDAE